VYIVITTLSAVRINRSVELIQQYIWLFGLMQARNMEFYIQGVLGGIVNILGSGIMDYSE